MASRSRSLGGKASSALSYYEQPDHELGIDGVLGYHKGGDGDKAFSAGWGGLAKELGLSQGVTREQFQELWDGQWEGGRKVIAGRNLADSETGEVNFVPRTSAFDVFATTPKSVSELLVKSTPEERQKIADAWTASLKVFVEEGIEGHARLARTPIGRASGDTKQQGSKTQRQTADIIAFPVVEYIARPTEEQIERGSPPDPHLHAHILVMSLCKADGRWYTADEYGLKERRNSIYRDQIINNEFTRRLEELGIKIDYSDFDRSRNGVIKYEVAGSDPSLRRFWSTNGDRAWKMRKEYEEETGQPMPDKLLTERLSISRLRKSAEDKEQDHRPVFELWADDARANGFEMRPMTHGRTSRSVFKSVTELERRLKSSNGLHVDDSTFARADIKPAVARAGVGLGFTQTELDGYADGLTERLVKVRPGTSSEFDYFTTPELLAAEKDIARYLDRQAKTRRLVNITGLAGTGKTTVLDSAIRQIRRDKPANRRLDAEQTAAARAVTDMFPAGIDQVIVGSMAAATAERTGRKVGADRAGSIESLCYQYDNRSLKVTDRSLVIIDEAAQLDTLRFHELSEKLERHGARLCLVGDSEQLVPISAGGWYLDQLDAHGSQELTVVRRQLNPADVRALGLIRSGRAVEGLKDLESRGFVHTAPDPRGKVGEVITDYRGFRNSGWQAKDVRILVDTSNVEVDVLNRAVQRDRMQRGELRPPGFEVRDTSGSFERRWSLHEGDQVVMLDSYKRRGQERIRNGLSGTITSLNTQTGVATVLMEPDKSRGLTPDEPMMVKRRIQLDPNSERQPVGLAYAQHIQRYQGHEVPITQNLPGYANTDRNHGYSLQTRATHQVHLYLDWETHRPARDSDQTPTQVLGEAWKFEGQKYSATRQIEEIRQTDRFSEPALRLRAERYANLVRDQAGDEVAERFVASERFANTVERLHAMEKDMDVSSMLRRVDMSGEGDPNLFIRERLEQQPEERSPAEDFFAQREARQQTHRDLGRDI